MIRELIPTVLPAAATILSALILTRGKQGKRRRRKHRGRHARR
jgi:hypothetical protein